MASDKFIMFGLDDERSKHIAEVLKNPTCKKILDYLGETKEASEKDIADSLNIPINTVEYNLKKLIKSGLVEKTKNFFWSVKGKKIPMYKLAKKHIIISPKNERPNMNVLKTIIPLILAVVLIAVIAIFLQLNQNPINPINQGNNSHTNQLKQFSSSEELKQFLEKGMETGYDSRNMIEYGSAVPSVIKATGVAQSLTATNSVSESAQSYSETNIQVKGVDEPDIVKNDGKYIYTLSGNKIVIVDAYPAINMKNLSIIKTNGTISNMFINKDKLVVFSSDYEKLETQKTASESIAPCYNCYPQKSRYYSAVYIYDIADKENPALENKIKLEGNYVDARMIGDYVYTISNKNAYPTNPEPPIYYIQNTKYETPATEVYYFDYYDNSYTFTSITSINLDNEEVNNKVYLLGYSTNLYVSQNNIFLTRQKRISQKEILEERVNQAIIPILPENEKTKAQSIMNSNLSYYEKSNQINQLTKDYSNSLKEDAKSEFDKSLMNSLEEFNKNIQKQQEMTQIYKININKNNIEYASSGEVPGHVLNQFSMDEYDNNFRIATTTGQVWNGDSLNHLYVLDENLNIIGKVEDLAPGEKIYSARFIGNKGYIVTFKKVDPLFVIDLSSPENPEVLGYLKITGYSDYLHPYDENHLIGIGKETVEAKEELKAQRGLDFAWYQGVKVSLFDVSDFENPKEVAKIEIGDRGTSSSALYDHKAVLFDKEKNLLVLPIQIAEVDNSNGNTQDNTYGQITFSGAIVLNISLDGITEIGKITHDDHKFIKASEEPIGAQRKDGGNNTYTKIGENRWKTDSYDYGYYMPDVTDSQIDSFPGGISNIDYTNQIKRSLYMDNTLYTISQSKIKANNLKTIEEINSLDLGY